MNRKRSWFLMLVAMLVLWSNFAGGVAGTEISDLESLRQQTAERETQELIVELAEKLEWYEEELELARSERTSQTLAIKRLLDSKNGLLAGFGLVLVVLSLAFARYRQKAQSDQLRKSIAQARAVNKKLKEIDQLKDDVLAATSHELQTPLSGIIGITESLVDGSRGDLAPEVLRDLELVVMSGQRLSRLVDDILDHAMLRRESLRIEIQPVELHTMVDVVLTLLRPLVAGKEVGLINAVDAGLPRVLADEHRLEQILHNLVGNAVKFTDRGHVTVSAAVKGFQVVIEVSDTGIGIDKQFRERIFEPFLQADSSTTDRRFSGTGLGLTVSRLLVELHRGRLWLASTSDEGSCFAFSLPAAEQAALYEETPLAEEVPDPETTWDIEDVEVESTGESIETWSYDSKDPRSGNILVVDDEPINLQVLHRYLTSAGFKAVLAAGADEAMRQLKKTRFDMVLLDIMMPRQSGYEVCRALREIFPIAELPVIFLAVKGREPDLEVVMDQGANDYLTKPISKRLLLARMRAHLDVLSVHRHLESLVEEKLSQIKVLRGLLPICSGCKKIRNDEGYWDQIEHYVHAHSEATFSHGICPDCIVELYGKKYAALSEET